MQLHSSAIVPLLVPSQAYIRGWYVCHLVIYVTAGQTLISVSLGDLATKLKLPEAVHFLGNFSSHQAEAVRMEGCRFPGARVCYSGFPQGAPERLMWNGRVLESQETDLI